MARRGLRGRPPGVALGSAAPAIPTLHPSDRSETAPLPADRSPGAPLSTLLFAIAADLQTGITRPFRLQQTFGSGSQGRPAQQQSTSTRRCCSPWTGLRRSSHLCRCRSLPAISPFRTQTRESLTPAAQWLPKTLGASSSPVGCLEWISLASHNSEANYPRHPRFGEAPARHPSRPSRIAVSQCPPSCFAQPALVLIPATDHHPCVITTLPK